MTTPQPGRRGARHLRTRPVLAIAVAAALVAAAGVAAAVVTGRTSDAPPTVVQLPQPSPPDTSTPTPTATTATSLQWKPCSKGECATLDVPVDWSGTDPAAKGMTVPLALFRVRATAPDPIGSLVVNPGGPGASGVAFVRDGLSLFPSAIRQRFDLVGFDPRGTGSSDPVHCQSGAQLDALFAEPPYPADPQQQQAIVTGAQQEASACATALGPLLRHLSTVDAARDLDAIRAALGEQRLTYLGYSYGTYLGATYTRLFPTHVRAFVLDGAIDPTQTGTQLISGQADGFEQAFTAFATWCAGNSSCAFGRSLPDADAVRSAYLQLAARVAQSPLRASRPLTSGLFLEGTLVTLYDRASGWPALGAALQSAQQGNGTILLTLADQFLGRNANGTYDPETEANSAVNCLDHAYPDLQQTQVLADQLAARDPVFGRAIAWSGLSCAYWKAPPQVDDDPVTATGAPPVLVVGTTRDPATPYAGAVSLAHQLADGRLLTFDGDGHTAYRATGSSCVVGVVDAYLLSLQAPPRDTGAHC